VPLIVCGGTSPHNRANIDSQKGERDDEASRASSQETSGKHQGHEPKHAVVKAVLTGIAVFGVAIAITWCTTGGFSSTTSNSVPVGNTSGNMANGGLAAEQDGWTYYINQDSTRGYSIRRISSEGKSASVIWSSSSTMPLTCLNVINDEVYFVSGDGICEVGTDGSDEKTIYNGSVGGLVIAGDEAYFLCDDGICRVDLDGSDEKTIYNDNGSTVYLDIVGDEVYFSGIGNSICKVGTDGSGEKTVYSGSADNLNINDLNIVGDEAYFVSDNFPYYSIRKVGLDGKDESTVWSAAGKAILNSLNVVGDEAYFESESEATSTGSYSICAVGTDGKGEKVIWSAPSGVSPIYLNIAGDEMYFRNANSNAYNNSLYRVDTDGENERTV
jgi:hypothetical protein